MRLLTVSSFVGLSLALTLTSLPAHAQTEAAKAQALKRYQEGIALHDRGREEEAYLQFTEAYAVVQTPPILFNLARTEQLTGRHVAAAEHFRAYVALPEHPRVTPALRAKAQGFLTELSAQLGHLTIDAPAGSVVSVDGKPIAAGTTTVDVEPGAHAVAAKRGDDQAFVNVVAVAGGTSPAHVVLGSAAVPVVPPPVVVVVPVGPPAHGEPLPEPLPHTKPAYWNGRRTAGVVIAGVGVIGLVIGGVEGAARATDTTDAASALTSARSASPSGAPAGSVCTYPTAAATLACTALSNSLSSNGSDAHVEDALLVGGGLLVAVGLITAFWPGSQEPPPLAKLAPMTGPHVAGLQWGGSF